MGVLLDSGIEAAVYGVEAELIAQKAQIQADHFNQQDHVHSFFWVGKEFCLLDSCLKTQPQTQQPIVRP
jgi:hypothetical protein